MYTLLPFVVFFLILPGWICTLLIASRKLISCMVGMMSAMTVGMVVGLGIGAIATIISPVDSFYAILLGILAGSLAGIAAGLPIGLMAVIDGLLSGLMAGMMGAMLADMISSSYHMILLQVLAILAGGIIFLLYLMLLGEIKPNNLSGLPLFYRSPAWIFTVILLGGIGLQQTGSLHTAPLSLSDSGNDQQHQGHELRESVSSPSTTSRRMHIQTSEFAYNLKNIQIDANDTVEIVLHNTGKIGHSFVIQSANIQLQAQPGETSSGDFRIAKPGNYKAICTVPGHQNAGMELNIEVV